MHILRFRLLCMPFAESASLRFGRVQHKTNPHTKKTKISATFVQFQNTSDACRIQLTIAVGIRTGLRRIGETLSFGTTGHQSRVRV